MVRRPARQGAQESTLTAPLPGEKVSAGHSTHAPSVKYVPHPQITILGVLDGLGVGLALVGVSVGTGDGAVVGLAIGTPVGFTVGALLGVAVGLAIGPSVGLIVGAALGFVVGAAIGPIVGRAEGGAVHIHAPEYL